MGSDGDTRPETLELELGDHAGAGDPIGRWWVSEVEDEIRGVCGNRGRG